VDAAFSAGTIADSRGNVVVDGTISSTLHLSRTDNVGSSAEMLAAAALHFVQCYLVNRGSTATLSTSSSRYSASELTRQRSNELPMTFLAAINPVSMAWS